MRKSPGEELAKRSDRGGLAEKKKTRDPRFSTGNSLRRPLYLRREGISEAPPAVPECGGGDHGPTSQQKLQYIPSNPKQNKGLRVEENEAGGCWQCRDKKGWETFFWWQSGLGWGLKGEAKGGGVQRSDAGTKALSSHRKGGGGRKKKNVREGDLGPQPDRGARQGGKGKGEGAWCTVSKREGRRREAKAKMEKRTNLPREK